MIQAGRDVVLSVRDLVVSFHGDEGTLRVLDGISFDLERGRILGLVGESGCGKSVTALSIMRLLPRPAGRIESGTVVIDSVDVLRLGAAELPSIRGRRVAMIFQEPAAALNPVHPLGRQLGEVFKLHAPTLTRARIRSESIDLLRRVGIPAPESRLAEYPHQLSGGMRQRVLIAMALAARPEILIADEPTTALDVTMQAQILGLLQDVQAEMKMSILYITHDLGIVANLCDTVLVMYAGRVVEEATIGDLFSRPRHPYTRGLLDSIPRLERPPKSRLPAIAGIVPSLNSLPVGCRFQDRCAYVADECRRTDPELQDVAAASGSGHRVACLRWRELMA